MTDMLALVLVCCVAVAGGAVIGLTTDIENCESGTPGGCDGLLDTPRNLSAAVHSDGPAGRLGLRLSTDIPPSWSYSNYSYHEPAEQQRPVSEYVMDIVDEVVLMDMDSKAATSHCGRMLSRA